MGNWKVIIPASGRNYILNPSAMGGGDYATIAVATITLDVTKGYFGYRNFKVVGSADNQGIRLTQKVLTNTTHYATVRTYGAVTNWDWSMDNSNWYAPALIGIEGPWYVYGYQFAFGECNASTYFRIQKNGAGAFTWYIGHVQVEQRVGTSTPFNGDTKGFTPDGYKWEGTPNSSSSIRRAWERSGGTVVDLEDTYNFRIMSGLGTGMPPIQHNVQDLALLPGALYAGHKVMPRILDLMSAPKTNTSDGVAGARANFENAIKPDKVYPEQPVVLRYTGINVNNPVDFHAVYDSGMEFQTSSGKIDKPTPRFICYDPFIYEVHSEGCELARQAPIANANYIVRKIDGVWSNIASAFGARITCLTIGKDGCVYIGGDFSAVITNGTGVVKWDPATETLSALGTGLAGGHCDAIITAPNGDVIAAGNFTSAGGVANTAYIAKWDFATQAWVSLSTTSIGNDLFSLAWGIDGTLFVGGQFTNAGGVANADFICRYTGTSWAAVGDVLGANGAVRDIQIGPNGDLYMTGDFTSVNSITVNRIAKYVGTPTVGTWSAMGTGLSASGNSIAIASNGAVYVGGSFNTANGVTVNNIAMWNGVTFKPLGTGANNYVIRIRFDNQGRLMAGGYFTEAGGVILTDRMAIWSGTSWAHIDINLPGTPIVYDFAFIGDEIYIGYGTAGTAYASVTTQVNVINTGSHSNYPKIGIRRANDGTGCTIKYIKNETTRHTIRMNYELQKGETLKIDFTPGRRSVVSSYLGNVLRAILRGSDFSRFCMQGGTNYISVYFTEAGSPTIMCWIEMIPAHWAADTAL